MGLKAKAKEVKEWVITGQVESIELLYNESLKGPKKLVAFAKRLYFETDPRHDDVRSICINLTKVKDPVAEVIRIRTKIREYAELVEGFVLNGAHGTIMTGPRFETIYPVSIDTLEHWLDPDDPWTREDEYEIGLDLVRAWMKIHNQKTFSGDVVLFPAFGFSGMLRTHNLTK